ncbi:MAG TPA: hypothetical protein VJI33_00705 [Candidatus Paceibacterota bacterium]
MNKQIAGLALLFIGVLCLLVILVVRPYMMSERTSNLLMALGIPAAITGAGLLGSN